MKNFDDFVKTLTEDEITQIINNCKAPLDKVASELLDNLAVGGQIGTMSMFISLGLLRRYHEWLAE